MQSSIVNSHLNNIHIVLCMCTFTVHVKRKEKTSEIVQNSSTQTNKFAGQNEQINKQITNPDKVCALHRRFV